MTSSNTGVPDISGSVYNKTQVRNGGSLSPGSITVLSSFLCLQARPSAHWLMSFQQDSSLSGSLLAAGG